MWIIKRKISLALIDNSGLMCVCVYCKYIYRICLYSFTLKEKIEKSNSLLILKVDYVKSFERVKSISGCKSQKN